jgi:hypothetical protein
MIESIDIAFLLVNKSSMNFSHPTVTHMISSIINPLSENNYDVRLALIKSRSNDDSEEPIIYSFTRSVIRFTHWFRSGHAPVGQPTQDETIAICKKSIVSFLSYFFLPIF